jgi:uncharacterized protein involved in exopolysaccharide biosynthesis
MEHAPRNITAIWAEAWWAVLGGTVVFGLMAWIGQDQGSTISPIAIGVFGGVITGLVLAIVQTAIEYSRRLGRPAKHEVNNG